jgi:hypothetical protein
MAGSIARSSHAPRQPAAPGPIPDVGDVVLRALCTLLVYEFVSLRQGILDEGALSDLDRS